MKRLSPSKAHRWLPCPGSLQFDVEGPESIWAEEGAHSHAVLEAVLKGQMVLAGEVIGGKPVKLEQVQQAIEVRDFLKRWHSQHPGWALESETPVEIGAYEYELPAGILAGTADAIMYSLTELVVLDAKFGFVQVQPEDNPQLILYAAGALHELWKLGFLVQFVTIIIAQPDYEGVMQFREHRMRQTDVAYWLNQNYQRVMAAATGELRLDASDDRACRYCPARANCTTRLEQLVKLSQTEWRDAHSLEDMLPLVAQVRRICKDLESEAVRQLREGHEVKGFKLVESRSTRQWAPETSLATLKLLTGAAQIEDVCEPIAPLSPAKLEKKFGAQGKAVTRVHAVIPRGRPKLAPESDPRPPVSLDSFTEADVDPGGEEE